MPLRCLCVPSDLRCARISRRVPPLDLIVVFLRLRLEVDAGLCHAQGLHSVGHEPPCLDNAGLAQRRAAAASAVAVTSASRASCSRSTRAGRLCSTAAAVARSSALAASSAASRVACKDGNGEFPVGGWLPVPVPTGT